MKKTYAADSVRLAWSYSFKTRAIIDAPISPILFPAFNTLSAHCEQTVVTSMHKLTAYIQQGQHRICIQRKFEW